MKSVNPYIYFDYPSRSWKEVYSEQNPQPVALGILAPKGINWVDSRAFGADDYYVNVNAINVSIGVDVPKPDDVVAKPGDIVYIKANNPNTAEIVGNLKNSSNGGSNADTSGVTLTTLFEAKNDSELGAKGQWTCDNVTTGNYIIKLSYKSNINSYTHVISSPIVISDLDLTRETRFTVPVNMNSESYIVIGYACFTLANNTLTFSVSSGIDIKIALKGTVDTNSVAVTVAGFYKIK